MGMYTSLKKKKTVTISGLVVKKLDKGHDSTFTIRNCDPDGLVVMRTYPVYSPWIVGIKIKKRFNVEFQDLHKVMGQAKFSNPEVFDVYGGIKSKEFRMERESIMEEDLWH